jgi:hypothetical protein
MTEVQKEGNIKLAPAARCFATLQHDNRGTFLQQSHKCQKEEKNKREVKKYNYSG